MIEKTNHFANFIEFLSKKGTSLLLENLHIAERLNLTPEENKALVLYMAAYSFKFDYEELFRLSKNPVIEAGYRNKISAPFSRMSASITGTVEGVLNKITTEADQIDLPQENRYFIKRVSNYLSAVEESERKKPFKVRMEKVSRAVDRFVKERFSPN